MSLRKYGVWVGLCLFCVIAKSQKTASYVDKDLLYKQGIDLFDKKQFVAAQKSFTDYLNLNTGVKLLKVDAEYYAAASAIELFHKDGEWRMREFITAHPESNKINGAWFYLGKSSYRKKKYEETIKNFDKVDIYNLTKEDLAELYFKRGYSFIETKNAEKAKADLYEIKDVDNKYIYPALYYYSHLSYLEKKYETALEGFNKLIGNETFGSVVPYYITQIYFVQGKYDKVVKSAPDLLNDSTPVQKKSEINRMIGESYYNLKDYANALDYLKKTDMGSSNIEGNYAIGYCYYKLNDYPNAITYLEKATAKEDSISQNAHYHLSECYLKTNDKTKAKNAFYSAYTLDFDKKITEDALYSFAKLSYELDFSPFNETVRAFSKYIKEYPASPRKDEAYKYLINVYSTTKNYDRAIKSMESLENQDLILKGTYEKLVFFRGVEYFNNADLDNAEKQFKKAMDINADKLYTSLSSYWLGEISYQRKDYGTAIDIWKNFLLQTNNVNLNEYEKTHYNLGYAYFQRKEKGDYAAANIEFRKYIMNKSGADMSKTADANVRAADCYFMNRDFHQAADYYETAIALNKVDVDYSYYQKALCNGLLKNHKEKINDLKYLEANYPKSNYLSAATFEMAETYLKDLKEDENAIIYYEKILSNFPKSSFVNASNAGLGNIYFKAKKDDKAFEYFDKFVKNNSKSDEAVVNVLEQIKTIFKEKGQIDEMEKYFASIGNPLSIDQVEKALYESAKDAYYNKTNCDEAMPKLESYISKFPEGKYITEVQFCYGECTYSKGMFDKALPAYKFVLSKSRNINTETSLNKASYLLYKDKNYGEALPLYLQMQEISETPANKLIAKVGAMRCAFFLNQFEIALTESNKVLGTEKLNPQQSSESKYIKAKSLFETQRYDDALTEFKAIAKSSKNASGAEAYYHIGKIYFNKQDYKEAEKTINNLISFPYTNDDWNTKGMLLIADCYVGKKDIEDAKVILQTILDGKPKQEYIAEVNARLDLIKQMEAAKAEALKAEQAKTTEMKVEFNTSGGDNKLFTQPVTVPADSVKTQVLNTIPN